MKLWIVKTDESGRIDLNWSSPLWDTEEEAYRAIVVYRKAAKHDEFFRLCSTEGGISNAE